MSTLQVDNINPYLSSSVSISGSLIINDSLTTTELSVFEQDVTSMTLQIKAVEGGEIQAATPSIGVVGEGNSPLQFYSYDFTSSLKIDNDEGLRYRILKPDESGEYFNFWMQTDGDFSIENTVRCGSQDNNKFAIEARSGIVQFSVSTVTITDQTGSFDVRNGNFFEVTLDPDVDNRFEFSELDGGQTINVLVTTAGSASVSYGGVTVLQPSVYSYVPTEGTAKDILTFISFDDTSTLHLVAVKNLV
jgi:hypothetical protein